MKSLWLENVALPQFERLRQDCKTQVLIIGGGIAGILCAYLLQQAGVPYLLVEANTLCSGITKNTTAKLTAQHGLIYHTLLRRFGAARARLYLDANLQALAQYHTLCKHIDCDYTLQSHTVYTRDDPRQIDAELAALQAIGYPAEYVTELPLPFAVAGAVRFSDQAQLHPLKFLAAIAKDLHIYEHTAIDTLIGTTAYTSAHKIAAQQVIVATHFPFLNRHGSYFLKLYQQRSYVLALLHAQALSGMYLDAASTGLSFRSAGAYLLLGGCGHRTGKQGGGFAALTAFAKENYPDAQIRYRWAAQDCMPLDSMPYIGAYARSTPNVYTATGFHKWGMSGAMAAAMLLCDLIQGKENPYAALFSPARSILRPQLAVNALESTLHLLRPTPRRCTHMGCALNWNKTEHSWDCACHGSRFAADGTLLDNPAQKNLRKKQR